tara:strand:- start:9 stop:167 length:159 start_codon:yes stop_codon:yes gene_type:complete
MFGIEIILLLILLIYIQSKPKPIIQNFSQNKPKTPVEEEDAYSFIERYNSFH